MNRLTSFPTVFTAGLLLTPLTACAQKGDVHIVLEPVVVRDLVATGEARDALTIFKPRGWRLEGGIKWYPNYYVQACPELRITNPNGVEQVEFLPTAMYYYHPRPVVPQFAGQNYLGFIVAKPIPDAKTYTTEMLLPAIRKNVRYRVVGHWKQPEVAKTLTGNQQLPRGAFIDAGRTRITYTLDGQEVEEDILVVVGGLTDLVFAPGQVNWGATNGFALRAKKGELDVQSKLFQTIIGSASLNPKWAEQHAEVVRAFQRRMGIGIELAVQLSVYTRQRSEEIAQLYRDAARNREVGRDRSSTAFSLYLRSSERFVNPFDATREELPSTHKYIWVNSSRQFVFTDNPGYDPNVGSTRTWKLLKRRD